VKVGDLVIINIPADFTRSHQLECVQGIVVGKRVVAIEDELNGVKNRAWWRILRSDTGRVEEFHDDWMKAGENESW
jgi:hypothetical protein